MKIAPAEYKDIALIAAAVAPYDVAELQSGFGLTPEGTMLRGLATGAHAWTVWDGEKPLGMFGVYEYSLVVPEAALWMVCTTHICDCKVGFARVSKQIRDALLARYTHLTNVMDCGRPEVLRWARWLGADIEEGEGMRPFKVNA